MDASLRLVFLGGWWWWELELETLRLALVHSCSPKPSHVTPARARISLNLMSPCTVLRDITGNSGEHPRWTAFMCFPQMTQSRLAQNGGKGLDPIHGGHSA